MNPPFTGFANKNEVNYPQLRMFEVSWLINNQWKELKDGNGKSFSNAELRIMISLAWKAYQEILNENGPEKKRETDRISQIFNCTTYRF